MSAHDDHSGDQAPHELGHGHDGAKRRDFMTLLAGSVAAVGIGAFAWPFIDSLSPPESAGADEETVDVEVGHLAPGAQMSTIWRGKPIFIVHRTDAQLLRLQDPNLTKMLLDPASDAYQQPAYAVNWHRSISPSYGVMVGICTHLGCVPNYFPNPSATTPVADWQGGYLCPCHGSRYDLAGRVLRGSPARYNLPVPPYSMPGKTSVRIGQSPDDLSFDFDSIKAL
jgi:ubiquinol-cytochrome c reductase iron-sulfur subunit